VYAGAGLRMGFGAGWSWLELAGLEVEWVGDEDRRSPGAGNNTHGMVHAAEPCSLVPLWVPTALSRAAYRCSPGLEQP
jgi:hypothetical protein